MVREIYRVAQKVSHNRESSLKGTQSTGDHRESAFLFQRLSMLIQRYNAVAVLGTFAHTTPEDEM